jgi:hypothetical protein
LSNVTIFLSNQNEPNEKQKDQTCFDGRGKRVFLQRKFEVLYK